VYLFDDWFDPIEAAVRDRVRGFIQAIIEGELDEKLQRPRYGRQRGRRLAASRAEVSMIYCPSTANLRNVAYFSPILSAA
jgi:hypothetical protein